MTANVTITVEGGQAFIDSFKTLATRITNTAMRDALKIALQPVVNAYTNELKKTTGTGPPVIKRKNGAYGPRLRLWMTAGSKVWQFPDRTGYAGMVGPRANLAPHARLIEEGADGRTQEGGKGFRCRKKIGGKYFIVEIWIQWGFTRKKTGKTYGPDDRTTGVMKAYHPLAIASAATQAQCQAIFVQEYAARVIAKGTA